MSPSILSENPWRSRFPPLEVSVSGMHGVNKGPTQTLSFCLVSFQSSLPDSCDYLARSPNDLLGPMESPLDQPSHGRPDTVEDLALEFGSLALLPTFPDDIFVVVLSRLEMHDIISVSRVYTKWRRLTLGTATLWWDARLNLDVANLAFHSNRFFTILRRSKETKLHVTITSKLPHRVQDRDLVSQLRDALDVNRHRISSLSVDLGAISINGLDALGLFSTSSLFGGLGGSESQLQQPVEQWLQHTWADSISIVVPSFDCKTVSSMILFGQLQHLPRIFDEVRDLEIDDYREEGVGDSFSAIVFRFPNLRYLSARVRDFSSESTTADFLTGNLKNLETLRILCEFAPWYYIDKPTILDFVINSTIKVVEMQMDNTAKAFLKMLRQALREDLPPEAGPWELQLRTGPSRWPRESMLYRSATKGRETNESYEVTLRLGDGRRRRFVFKSFSAALEAVTRPILRDTRTNSVIVDGVAGYCLLYSGADNVVLNHVRTLRAITNDDQSLPVPRRPVHLPGLQSISLERRCEEGSCLSLERVVAWFNQLQTPSLLSLDTSQVFVYGDAATVSFTFMAATKIYERPWCQNSKT